VALTVIPPFRRRGLAVIQILTVLSGCDSPDARLAEYAERARQQQVEQTERLAHQSQAVVQQSGQLASAAQQLVEQDAAARRELLQAQQQLQQQSHANRAELNRQQAQLDTDRKTAAAAARRDPVIAEAVTALGLILAALLPLVVTVYAIRKLPEDNAEDRLLAEELWELGPQVVGRESTSDALPGPATSRLRLTTSSGEPLPGDSGASGDIAG
jgi:hypothetical protein